jgi:hypothetical protein
MLATLLFSSLYAAESPVGGDAPFPPNVPVVVAEVDLANKLSTLGPRTSVGLFTANKPQENALQSLLAESATYRYLRAGSASEVWAPLREASLACGVFLARQGAQGWRATAIGQCETQPAVALPPVQPAP